jgi:uroporphyrinogen decarboxylase
MVRDAKPDAKIIGFPRGAGQSIPRYVDATGVNAVSLETNIDRVFARDEIQSRVAVQGNLDPEVLRSGGTTLDRVIDEVLQAFSARPFIFNLGHGILPDTPVANVDRMLTRVRLN